MHLDAIAGNARARGFLARAMARDRVSHAYLFTGPAGVGKTATALAFAADLLEAAGSPPANVAHPDLWVEDTGTESISIDVIRMEGRTSRPGAAAEPAPEETEAPARLVKGRRAVASLSPRPAPAQTLQGFLSLRGMHSQRRVAVLARAERLKETAAAPLLKTIEEPPEGAVLVLCTEAADLLPATIRSRCQEVEFQRLTDAELSAFVLEHGLELSPRAQRLAQGCPGRALRLAADPAEVERRLEWADLLEGIRGAGWLEVVGLGARFGSSDPRKNRTQAREALQVWEGWLRDTCFQRVGAPELASSTEAVSGVPGLGGLAAWDELELPALLSLWESTREASERVLNNVNPRLAIEVFLGDVVRGFADADTTAPADYFGTGPWQRVPVP